MDKKVLNNISYGMYVIATKYNDRKVGCFVNTVTQITSQNPIISVSINKDNYTNEALKNTKKFSVSILSEETDSSVIGKFGFFSSKDTDKFSEFNCVEVNEIPVLKEKDCGNLICEVIDIIDVETHDIFIARVLDTVVSENNYTPMTYKYYHEVIKGKAPKTAPTYVEEINDNLNKQQRDDNNETINNLKNDSDNGTKKYRCTICGHVYDESIEGVKFTDLPDSWVCPICRVGKSLFEEIK